MEVRLPYNYEPRSYQLPFFEAMDRGLKRAILVHHRRAGKDLACFNFMIKQAYTEVGNYFYMFPEYAQAKKAIWEAKANDGRGYLDYIPKNLIKRIDNQEMLIELNNAPKGSKNGSIIRLVNADKNRLVGAGPKGIVLSEYSLIPPDVWPYIEPMIIEKDGWAVFNGTPRGENHFYKLYMMAKDNQEWYASKLGINETKALDEMYIEKLRAEGATTEEQIQQEYYCSFRGSMNGAYYSDHMDRLLDTGKITNVPYDPNLPVHTAWDLGVADATAIWFYQQTMGQIRLIDCYSASGEGLEHYFAVLKSKPYNYGDHYAPHDIKVTELGTGRSRLEYAAQWGVRFKVVPKIKVQDGIECTRITLKRCWFDKNKTAKGVHALRNYSKTYDTIRQDFSDKPDHNWTSHYADAFRYLCVSLNERYMKPEPAQTRAIADYVEEIKPQTRADLNIIFTTRQRNYLKEDSAWVH